MDRTKIKRYLWLGILGALVTVAGELLQDAVTAPDGGNEMSRLFSAIEALPVWRIGLGSTLGGLGILMQWFGFQGIFLSFDNQVSRLARAYRFGNAGFTIIGAMMHILLSMWMYVYKFTSPLGMGADLYDGIYSMVCPAHHGHLPCGLWPVRCFHVCSVP